MIGSEIVKINRNDREVILKDKLDYLCSDKFIPENQVNINYMYYNLISNEEGPELLKDDDFPTPLKDCVSWP